VLGKTGRNFAAGMSGGIAYVLDPSGSFVARCNRELVDLDPLAEEDEAELRVLLETHASLTGSTVAEAVIDGWRRTARSFVKVAPRDFKRAVRAAAAAGPAVSSLAYAPVAHG
jgi:glutamate synthase (NADPH/NADH) large chain